MTESPVSSHRPWISLESTGRPELITLWTDLFGAPPPPNMSQVFLRRFIAFEMQARATVPLPVSLKARLLRIAVGKNSSPTPTLQPGGRYLRVWNGVTHVVDVTEPGYLWKGQHHRSLSAIARAITGAQWSGPRFFGPVQGGKASKQGRATK
ncbi:DUF2924 domain-containing protein [Seohaeicola sp. SP36]|uniref:DUF2924 domain-containing protein n=1 Tax=unclassified Seohaeicola TaxID=2641111 RepID=UPI00237AF917|nr:MULTISPECIES: DUF2924 domain-containing protein [unclassified Seohaeicola]MDD9709244.1 DUF2924 domain-containing protein [Seohaeicola sp. 4SK31]MDD9737450.1 DUF2924 domain-containing protein [Seohaeicola sp. SP36]